MELRLDNNEARAMLERQGARQMCYVEVGVLRAQQWVKERSVAVCAEPTRTNSADLVELRSTLWHREPFEMLKLMDRDNFRVEACKETLPVPLSVAAVAQTSWWCKGKQRFSMKLRPKLLPYRLVTSLSTQAGFFRACCRNPAGFCEGNVAELVVESCWWSDSGVLGRSSGRGVCWLPNYNCRLKGRVTILAPDLGDSVMIDTCVV